MTQLPLEQKNLNRYLSLFTICKKRNIKIVHHHDNPEPDGPTKWVTGKWPWTPNEILRHFAGLDALGLHWGPYVNHLMLDFDTHDSRSVEETREIAQEVIQALPGEWIFYQSSFSQGIRAACFLDQHYRLTIAAKWLDHKLRKANFTPESGGIESRMTGQGDRLPFGKGSMLLDPATLMPRDDLDLRGTIAWVFKFAQQNRLTIDESEIPQNATDLIRQEKESIVQRLKDEGLWPGGLNANDAFLPLSRHLRGDLHLSPQETAVWLKNWIREKHNGRCDRILRGECDEVDSQIDRVMKNYDCNKYSGRGSMLKSPQFGLPLNDVRALLHMTRDFKKLKASFSLLTYITKVQINRGNLHLSGNLQYVIYLSGNFCDLECPIPWETLRKLDGFPKDYPNRMMAKLERLEIIKRKRNHCRDRRQCRVYSVLFRFSRQHSQLVTTLEEGLALILEPRELRQLFSRHLTEKILTSAKRQKGGQK